MTPRRVQIWFQNRRQGMKKTQDQRTDTEPTPTATPTNTYNRARGYSFGTYPVPSDASSHSQSQPQNPVYPSGLPAYTPTVPASTNPVFDSLPNHLYTSRPFTRDGMPRQLPQLQLRNNASNSSLSTLNESACSDFAWSEPSAASSTWNGSTAGYPIISAPSFADRERLFPFGKQLSHPYETSHSQEFSIPGQSSARQDHPVNRSRSQTNPDFFQLDITNNIHHPLSQSELTHQSSSQPSQDRFRKSDEYATPTQRLVSLETDCIPDHPDSVTDNHGYDGFNLHDQVETASASGEWDDALSRLKVADYPDSNSPKHSMDRMLSFHGGIENDIYPLNYSTSDYTNDPMMGRNCADIADGLSTSDYVGVGANSHLHFTEPQMINDPEDLDKCIQSSSPGHYRQRSRSFNG
ncbi:hypothetical protein DFH28DRAFT_919896 [Melampsora americana]|nr:hypothetical protein DFH28DRAFT_919896 [Melampsora americana]